MADSVFPNRTYTSPKLSKATSESGKSSANTRKHCNAESVARYPDGSGNLIEYLVRISVDAPNGDQRFGSNLPRG